MRPLRDLICMLPGLAVGFGLLAIGWGYWIGGLGVSILLLVAAVIHDRRVRR